MVSCVDTKRISVEIDTVVYDKLKKTANTLKVSPDCLARVLLQEDDLKS